jgi:hypothetical protein
VTENIAGTRNIDWKKMGFLFLGIALFTVVYLAPAWPDAIDPMGKHFPLNREAKGAIAVFLLAATWWVFEVVPIGVTPAWLSAYCRPCFSSARPETPLLILWCPR